MGNRKETKVMKETNKFLNQEFDIDNKVLETVENAELKAKPYFEKLDEIAAYNQYKVLSAFQKNKVSEMHLNGTTGYGYNDAGREVIEKVYADIFKAEDALVRLNMLCGTHALKVALFGNLKCNDELLFPCGEPYDTLKSTVGMNGAKGSLLDYGIKYKVVPLKEDESFEEEKNIFYLSLPNAS